MLKTQACTHKRRLVYILCGTCPVTACQSEVTVRFQALGQELISGRLSNGSLSRSYKEMSYNVDGTLLKSVCEYRLVPPEQEKGDE